MSIKIDDGGPAFPHTVDTIRKSGGLTLRDYFAAQIAPAVGFARCHERTGPQIENDAAESDRTPAQMMALMCYQFADAMISERNK